ncbi:MAG: PilZ domain-containing protein [Candidatus Eisenbacteria bacterium]
MNAERVERATLERVFTPGVVLELLRREQPRSRPLKGVMSTQGRREWSLSLAIPNGQDPDFPRTDEWVDLVLGRLDGLYRVSGVARRDPDPAGSDLRVRIDPRSAQRSQRRAFYRLPGHWPARIRFAGEGHGQAATVRDLSAGGILVEDRSGRVEVGAAFMVTIDLEDGAAPLTMAAAAVRADRDRPTACWGCRFLDPSQAEQERILSRLHALTRQRLAADRASRRPTGSIPETP